MKTILKALFLLVALTSVVGCGKSGFEGDNSSTNVSAPNDQSDYEVTKSRAEAGDALSQFSLGLMYANGSGVAQSDQEAVKWYRLAAEQGLSEAQDELGLIYVNGTGVDRNHQEALRWWRLAAVQGNARAQDHLLSMYNVITQTYIRAMYDKGISVAQNEQELFKINWFKEGAKWYRLKAEEGYDFAQYSLGDLYEDGRGVQQNYQEAVKWYRLAATNGYVQAQIRLGYMYEIGRGVTLNNVRAYVWFSVAAAQGNEFGRIIRDSLSDRLTPEERSRGQELATICFESNFQDCD